MTNAELLAKIKAEIERLKGICTAQIKENPGQTFPFVMEMTGYDKLLSFLSALESENPEPYNPVYDEAYLNEKIKKATESWKGVDVDAMLAECRGYDEEKSEKPIDELEVEIALYLNQHFLNRIKYDETIDGFTTFDAWDMAKYFYELGCTRTAERYDEIEYNRQRAEESVSKDLEEAARQYATHKKKSEEKEMETELPMGAYYLAKDSFTAGARWQENKDHETIKLAEDHAFLAGADWQKEHNPLPEDTVLFNKGVAEGKRLMMEEAVAVEVVGDKRDLRLIDSTQRCLFNAKRGDWLKIIIVKEDEK